MNRAAVVCCLVLVLAVGCSDGGSSNVADNGPGPGPTGNTIPTTTINFPFSDFTAVAITGGFIATIVPGPFSVQVTADTAVMNQIEVTESGQVLNVTFLPGEANGAQTRDVQITMPALSQITLEGAANASVFDFAGSTLDVRLTLVAMLEGWNLSYDLLMASADDVSQLTMDNVRPFPAADIHLSNVSRADVRMMDAGLLTGTGRDASLMFYYGTDVTVDFFMDNSSAITNSGP